MRLLQGVLLDASMPSQSLQEDTPELDLQNQSVMLDWKGEPMKINPGDKLPFNFN